MFRALLNGALAGAAGTTALNAATYLDMAARGRPASETPQQAADELGKQLGHPVPGAGEERHNRLGGLGPLLGIATGVGIGAAAGVFRPVVRRLPLPLAGLLVGAAAMAASDTPLKKLGLTDPSTWSVSDWASDAIPHLAYGIVTCATLRATRPTISGHARPAP
jgi:hypothetical protein